MIVVDANILLYAHDASSPRHPAAVRWLETTFGGSDAVGLALMTVLAFIRIATDPRIYEMPMLTADAVGLVDTWLARTNVHLIGPTERHRRTLSEIAAAGQARGPMTMDAHLAALTLEHGATLATADRDFSRFPGLRSFDPTTPDALRANV